MNVIDEDIQKYIKVNSSSKDPKNLQCEMASYLQTLDVFESQLTDKVQKINEVIQCAINFYPSRLVRMRYTPKVCFIVNKYLNIFMKYQGLKFSRYRQAIQAVVEFRQVATNHIAQNIEAEYNFWEYIAVIFSKTDNYLQKLEFKLKSLYHYIQNLKTIEKIPTYSDSEMMQEIKELIPEVDLFNGFIHQNKFDLMFECYVESSNELRSVFDQIMKISPKQSNSENDSINQTKNSKGDLINTQTISHLILNNFDFLIETVKQKASQIKSIKKKSNLQFKCSNDSESNRNKQSKFDLKLFDKLINSIYTKITSPDNNNKRIQVIIRCAALRYLCNKYYINHSNEWLEKPSQTYFNNVEKIVKETPRDLLISMDIIPQAYYDTSFDKLLLGDDFLKAANHIFSIQFYTCPIDIWKEMYGSIVSSMTATNKFTNISNNQSKISFDDFFTILLPVFSSARITCPNALNSLLSSFLSLKKQNSLEIASTTILALLKIIETKM